ncbi:hypothetical protein Tco_0923800 [Tanacetum coccineum]|uniref:Uncharacterized protein n=1 Tax=Tanacetum coccineum TaxID=301880 RepID=A0ABQ5D1Z4_9ASTR
MSVEISTSTALVSCDGLGGYDWSDQADEGPNYIHMAFSSSNSDSEVSNDSICSKSCLKTIESIKSQNNQLLKDLKKSKLMVLVPPPYIGNFMPLTPDLSFTGLDEFVNKPIVENCKAMSSKEEPKVVRKNDDAPKLLKNGWQMKRKRAIHKWIYRVGKGFSGKVTSLFPVMVTQTPRELTSMDTEIPLSSGPTKHVDEAVHKERGDSLVRAATIASSLEAECQETMGDIISQTRFENVSKLSNDSLLARVLDLEKTKTTQAEEIVSLKRRVKKLEQKKRSRTHGLKRLRMVGATARVGSSKEEEVLGEDASKYRRSDNVDTLFRGQDKEMLNTGEEVVVVEEINERRNVVDEVAEVIKTAQVSDASEKVSTDSVTTTTKTTEDDLTLAQAMADLKSTKPKAKGIVFREPGESTTTISLQQLQDKGLSQDKEKRILVEPEKPLKKKDQLMLDEEIALKLQQKVDDVQEIVEVDNDQEAAKIKELMEIIPNEEEVTIDVVPLATKPLTIID